MYPNERPKNQPEKKIRAGAIAATIWKNEVSGNGKDKEFYYSVSLDRSYKDKSGEWKRTGTLRPMDLPKAVLILNKAYEYLTLEKQSGGDESPQGNNSEPIDIEDIETIM